MPELTSDSQSDVHVRRGPRDGAHVRHSRRRPRDRPSTTRARRVPSPHDPHLPKRTWPSAKARLETQASTAHPADSHPAPLCARQLRPEDVRALRPLVHTGRPRRRGPAPRPLWPGAEGHGVGKRRGTRRAQGRRGRGRHRRQAQGRHHRPHHLLFRVREWQTRHKGPLTFPFPISALTTSQLVHLLGTINLALASPPLTPSILKCSKAYLFLLPAAAHAHREKIVGCVIAQRISTAMAVVTPDAQAHPQSLVAVDTSSGLFCHPNPLPTPLGIPRLFVSSAHRRQGIATHLLSAAAATFIHGCPLDPAKGQVAFTQPTQGGGAVMEKWGKGFVRIYQE